MLCVGFWEGFSVALGSLDLQSLGPLGGSWAVINAGL